MYGASVHVRIPSCSIYSFIIVILFFRLPLPLLFLPPFVGKSITPELYAAFWFHTNGDLEVPRDQYAEVIKKTKEKIALEERAIQSAENPNSDERRLSEVRQDINV